MQKVAPFQASKWLEAAALLDIVELKELFETLKKSFSELLIFRAGALLEKSEVLITSFEFEERYRHYLESLLSGRLESLVSAPFFLSSDQESVVLSEAVPGQQKVVARLIKPVVQLQFHRFDYSTLDGKFHSMMHGSDVVHFGLHFSYPQLYFDQEMRAAVKSFEACPQNSALFKEVQQWMRKNTIPTPFLVGDKKINATFRIGRKCFSWIDEHPGLRAKGLKVLHAN